MDRIEYIGVSLGVTDIKEMSGAGGVMTFVICPCASVFLIVQWFVCLTFSRIISGPLLIKGGGFFGAKKKPQVRLRGQVWFI